jgi:predicted permease
MLGPIRSTLRAMFGRSRWERDLDEELRSHIEHRAADLIRAGKCTGDAERQARLELGSGEGYREECRRAYGLHWLDELGQDLRYAFRALRRSPGFTAVAVLSLALGIGANTAVFGVLEALVLRPLPVRAPEELVFVEPTTHSFPYYRDLRDRNVALAGLMAYRVSPVGLGTGDAASRGWAYLATGNYFDVLGVKPLAGRFFHAEDEVSPGASALAVLSFDCWRNRFSANASIVGRSIRVNGRPYTVLGVAPAGFHGTESIYWPDVWVPMAMEAQIEEHDWLENRGTSDCLVAGRLKPHVTRGQAEANLRAIADDLARTYPRSDAGIDVRLSKLGLAGNALRNPMEAFVFGVIALAAMVLLAACANLASLMTARAADRGFEIAIRVSIGASRGRIVRQLMTESAFLALVGCVAGCGLAALILGTLSRLSLAEIPVRVNMTADWRVFLFGLAAALASALLFGAAPARQGLQASPNQALRGGASACKPGRGWPFRELLLAAQVALCCVLVTACFVAMRGAQRAFQMPVGIQPRGVSVTGFDLGLAQYTQKDGEAFQRRTLDAALQLPGVAAAAFADSFPLGVDQSTGGAFRYAETDFRSSRAIRVSHYEVSPGYFRTIGTRVLAGRDFTWHDDAKSPLTAIVNQTFARKVLGDQNGVGLYYRVGDLKQAPVQVIGIVEDGKYQGLTEDPRPAIFRPMLQNYSGTTYLLTRAAHPGDAHQEAAQPGAALALQMERAVQGLDRGLPLYSTGALEKLLDVTFLQARAAAWALSAFGLLALMLAVTGIYGLSAYTVSRRVREIGIRVAIGAQPSQVLRSVLGRMAAVLGVGALAGIAGGIASTTVLAHVAPQATPRDPMVLGGVAVTMLAVALLSCWAPARRAISVDPIRSLRHE